MTLKCVSVEVVTITPELALKFRDMYSLRGERELLADRAKWQLKLLEEGQLHTMQWGRCLFTPESRKYRLNGNHTSHLITACYQAHNGGMDENSIRFVSNYLNMQQGRKKKTAPQINLPNLENVFLKASVEDFVADTYDDLLAGFQRYDNKASARKIKDVLGTYIGKHDDITGLEKSKIAFVLAGIHRASLKDPQTFGFVDYRQAKLHFDNGRGAALSIDKVRQCVRWVIETVPSVSLYRTIAGAQVMSETWAKYGEETGSKIIEEIDRQLQEGEDPAASWEDALTKTRNRPTIDNLVGKGRKAITLISREILAEV